MKILKILFLLCSLFVFTFWGMLVSTSSQSTLSAELTTETPLPVAFKQFLLLQSPGTIIVPQAVDTISLNFQYFDTPQSSVKLQMIVDSRNYQVRIVPQEKDALTVLSRVEHQIRFKTLADGSTNIVWQMRYHLPGLSSRFLNLFFWKPQFNDFLNKKIVELRKKLES